jgi:hypothetical protein
MIQADEMTQLMQSDAPHIDDGTGQRPTVRVPGKKVAIEDNIRWGKRVGIIRITWIVVDGGHCERISIKRIAFSCRSKTDFIQGIAIVRSVRVRTFDRLNLHEVEITVPSRHSADDDVIEAHRTID